MTRNFLLVLVLLASSVRAEPLDPRAQAKQLKDAGARAFDQGDAATALARFEDAYRIFPSPNLKYNMAVALDQLGRRVEAIEAFERFLASAADAPASATERARKEITRIDRELGHIQLVAQPGAEVILDDKPLGLTPLLAAPRVVPGPHTLRVTKPGYLPYRVEVKLGEGMIWSSEIALVALPPRRISKVPPLVMGGVALALTAVGAGLRAHSQIEFDRLHDSCAPDCARSSWAGLPAQQNAGNVILGVAGAAIAVDVGLWIAYGLHK